jgi:hypothetical protein
MRKERAGFVPKHWRCLWNGNGLGRFLVKIEVAPLRMAPATAQINRLLAFARPCVVAE